jgi:hypothetical protein
MMFFHRFPSEGDARAFAREAQDRFGLGATVCGCAAEAQAIDPFPGDLDGWVVVVERAWRSYIDLRPARDASTGEAFEFSPRGQGVEIDTDEERAVRAAAEGLGGVFAGT